MLTDPLCAAAVSLSPKARAYMTGVQAHMVALHGLAEAQAYEHPTVALLALHSDDHEKHGGHFK